MVATLHLSEGTIIPRIIIPVSYTHLRAHETLRYLVCRLLLEKKSYRKLISDLYFVYEAMEEEIARLVYEEHPVIKPIGFKSLFRKETLENDLKFYFGENWKNEINICLLYTSPSPRDATLSRMPSSA